MGKRISDSQIRKSAYSSVRAALLRAGASRADANTAGRAAGQAAIDRITAKRDADRAYAAAKRAALRAGAPLDVALEQGRKARKRRKAEFRLKTRAEPQSLPSIGHATDDFICIVDCYETDEYGNGILLASIQSWNESYSLPIAVQALIPSPSTRVLGGYYTAVSSDNATRVYSLICTANGKILAQTPTALNASDSRENAIAIANIPTYYRQLIADEDASGVEFFIITIFAAFVGDL